MPTSPRKTCKPASATAATGYEFYENALRDLETGEEHIAARGPVDGAILSRDGGSLILDPEDEDGNFAADVRGGPTSALCAECQSPTDWSPDGAFYAATSAEGRQGRARIVDIETGESSVLFEHPTRGAWDYRFSPDGRWLAFHLSGGGRDVFVAQITEERPVSVDSWIPITDCPTNCSTAAWSSEGDRIYYLSDAEGTFCLYSRPLDPFTKRPIGPPVEERHFHDPRWSIPTNSNMRYEIHGDRLIIR